MHTDFKGFGFIFDEMGQKVHANVQDKEGNHTEVLLTICLLLRKVDCNDSYQVISYRHLE